MKIHPISFVSVFIFTLFLGCDNPQPAGETFELRLSQNTWLDMDYKEISGIVGQNGIEHWSGEFPLKVYFYASKKGRVDLDIAGLVDSKSTNLTIELMGQKKNISLNDKTETRVEIGEFFMEKEGYQCVEIHNQSQTAVSISSIFITPFTESEFYSIPQSNAYFGRRGPSVHLNYQLPTEALGKDIHWYYNELQVPEREDVIGSFFMANGFGQGYFGIQVNSEKERRILFSVWSPFVTDNPKEIPKDQKIKLIDKGEGVHTGEFGDEGSGGQSYKVFPWEAGKTYRFLLQGKALENEHTQFTAYFYAPEIGKWELIASFERPKTGVWLTRFHSFLENFIPETGNIRRRAFYKNPWICDVEGKWYPISKAKFSADATAKDQHRFDFGGGSEGGAFYLENCGFFSSEIAIGSEFVRDVNSIAPEIDFNALPAHSTIGK